MTITAKMIFAKGVRVEFLASHRAPILPKRTKGTVVGFGHNPDFVRVLLDGKKYAATWHKAFWNTIEKE